MISSKSEFDFSLLIDEISSIHKEIDDRRRNNDDGNDIWDLKMRKIRRIDCEGNSSSEDIVEDTNNSK